jgi:DNA-binding transcriptional LysR family regulator
MIPCTLRQLQIFMAAAEDCHFVRTANRLGISQPAVTTHIGNLEHQLGKKLFIRRKGSTPVLSADGIALLKQARVFVEEAEKIRVFQAREDVTANAVVRVCAGAHLLEDCLKPALSDFYESHPQLTLHCEPTPSIDKGRQMLERGMTDILLYSAKDPRLAGHHVEVLRPVRFGLYVGSKYAEHQHASPEEIAALPFILPLEGSEADNMVQTALIESGILCSRVAARAQYSDIILQMAKHNHGVAALFETMVADAVETGELIKLDVELPMLYRCMFRLNQPTSPAVQAVEVFLRELLSR